VIEDNTEWEDAASFAKLIALLLKIMTSRKGGHLSEKSHYNPIKLKTAYASASQGAIVPRTGTKAASPKNRKNSHIHQPEIVLGIDTFISYSPLRGRCRFYESAAKVNTHVQRKLRTL
jgi:hypothetical protein